MESVPICLSCGLCCDGSLFADVKLRAAEAHRLPADAPLEGAGRGKGRVFKLVQPCFGWRDGVCSIYESRPEHCRKFDCDLLGRMGRGEVSETEALGIVRECRAKVDEARGLMRSLGNKDEHASISERFGEVGRRALAGGLGRRQMVFYGELTVVMHELHCLLAEHIYPV